MNPLLVQNSQFHLQGLESNVIDYRMSGNNWATDRSPYGNKSKAVGINSPNYISDKRKVYGQYNKSPDNRAVNDTPIHHKTPRQLAVYPTESLSEAPPTNFKLVPCSK